MSTGQTNLKALKNDLKAWKNSFIEEHGREPTKDDVKSNPQIAAKHKLWKELEKVSKQRETSSTQPVTSDSPTTPLPVRRSKPKQSNSNAQPQPSIFKHAKATVTDDATLAAAASANPFSPTKRRPASQVRKPLLSQVDDPFVASPSSSSATAAEPPNPFAPSTSSPSKKSRHANLFATPAKSRPRVSETAIAPSLAEMLMSAGEVRSNTRGEMRHGTSPKKLRQLASVARDTPRTKARKRMRGEEVEQTPGDKRRRITKPPSPIPQENDEDVDDDDEIMDLSPVKPPPRKSGKGKAFQPVFEDDLMPSKPKPVKAPQGLFFSGSSLLPAKGSTKSPSLRIEPQSRRSTSVSAATESLSTTPDPPSDTPAEGSGIEPSFTKRKGKRSLAETEDSASSRSSPPPESTITSLRDEPPLPPGMANPFGLRPPSPLLEQASQTKGKGKWGERKKGRMDKAVMEDDEEGAEDDSTEDVKEVDLRARTGFRRTTSENQKSQVERPGVSFEEDPMDRFWLAASQRPRDESPPPTAEETLQVDLPDEMKRVLHIESPSKRRTEETIVHGLFKGELAPEKLKKQEVWGAGELDSPEDEEENDWDSEPEGWKGVVEM
ncbi:hypothetical protein M407DRAFT_17361 [Tulasnella calospora MUT 4182]|uniref:DNA replication regulator SLD2 n=1 Tax=Tulasnella calospora MUT 4182 TaxID=1051891 RepID=A0A0C3QLR7_9AGAM|nr:hypothetical protein M407DRAFT_17361 [Tulasnella calospora MUT 4182]